MKSKSKQILFTPSEEMLKLEAYISSKNHGDFITYKELKEELGIDIRTQRGIFYSACRRLGRECSNKPNYGYQLSSAGIALPIVNQKVDRVVASSKRMVKSAGHLKAMHKEEMSEPQIAVLDNCEFSGNAIAGNVRSMKQIIRKEQPQLSAVTPTA